MTEIKMPANGSSAQTTEFECAPPESHYTLMPPPKPRPSDQAIRRMMATYYDSLAEGFDQFNSEVSFGLYLEAINKLVATELKSLTKLDRLLAVGAGTGAREIAIRRHSNRHFQICCLDLSESMCALAQAKGLETICEAVSEAALEPNSFDAAVFLNAFEVLTSDEERSAALKNISICLRPGGLLFLDAMDIENKFDVWAEKVKEQFYANDLQHWGYQLGDCFCRRSDQDLTVFAHYSTREEITRLLAMAELSIKEICYLGEDSGAICQSGEGHMFVVAQKENRSKE